MQSLSIAATGMLAQQLNVEVISHNLANMNTTGFKRQRAEFQDLLYQNLGQIGASSSEEGTIDPSGIQVGLGVRTASIYRVTSQGNLNQTNNQLDLAIDGRGYLRVQRPGGDEAYTRAGSLQMGPNGELVTTDGLVVQPTITIPTDTVSISINQNGQVEVTQAGVVGATQVGQLELALFQNDAGLEAVGDNLFLETAASGTPTTGTPGAAGFGRVLQGFLETSNVNAVGEITSLITAQRAYEMNAKVISTTDEMLAETTNLR